MIPRICKACHKLDTFVNLRKYSYGARDPAVPIMRDINDIREKPNNRPKIPIITSKRKQFNFNTGDKYSKFHPVLVTKGWTHDKSKGDYFTIHPLPIEKKEEELNIPEFKDFDFNPQVLKNLDNYGFEKPTLIQMKAFPSVMNGFNTMIAAETGSGKTMAYLLPMIHQILASKPQAEREPNRPLALIITPSRELAVQIRRDAKRLANGLDVNVKLIIGGRTKRSMRNPLVSNVDILIATLGVLSKYVTNRIFKLDYLQHVVLDEADSLFHETFHEKLKPFLRKIRFCFCRETALITDPGAQLTLASATMPSNVAPVIDSFINMESLKSVTTEKLHLVHVPQQFLRVGPMHKPMLLLKMIKEKALKRHGIIIFTNTSITCDWLTRFLREFGVQSIHLNAKMKEYFRRGKYAEFKSGRVNVLVTTDAGSRGLDTKDVRYVVNFDFPLQTSEYIHRCGRTGRVGSPKDCKVINFISRPLEIILAQKLEIAARRQQPIPMIDMLFDSKMREYDSLLEKMDVEEVQEYEKIQEAEENEQKEEIVPF